MPEWDTYNYGIFSEHQWRINPELTNFIGIQVDKDEYTHDMWSPRWAMIATPNAKDTFKFIVNRSVRKNIAEELRKQHEEGQTAKPEVLEGIEMTYSHDSGRHLNYGFNAFYDRIKIIGVDINTLRTKQIAEEKLAGLEFEFAYKADSWQAGFSHSYTKLQDYEVNDPGFFSVITAEQFGYGDDLMHWSNHITKLTGHWNYNQHWHFNSSARVFWGYPGAEDYRNYSNDLKASDPESRVTAALTDVSYDKPFRSSVFLNMGAHYLVNQNTRVSINGYNLLGFLDKDYNKRIYYLNLRLC